METADDSAAAAADAAAAAGQMETQEQLEEEEVRTNTQTIYITAITDHWTRFTEQGMFVNSVPLD